MKNRFKIFLTLGLMVILFCVLGISASAYGTSVPMEPNGSTETKYEFDSSECDRTIVVNIYDEDTGSLIKKVNVKTKRGEDTLDIIKIYGYRITSFSSDQGLWETCKLGDSHGLQIYGDIYIKYYFRTALSKEQLNVTVYMDKFNDLTIIERHIKQEPYGNTLSYSYYPVTYSREIVTNTGRYVSMGRSYTGFTIRNGWKQYISGNFTYKWVDDYENIASPITSMEWDIINGTCEDKYYNEFDEDEDGYFTYCDNRTMNVDFEYLRNKYTVYFDANGGTGAVPASQTQYYDYTVTIGNEVPYRSGYVFRGWGTYSSDTTPNYQPGDTYTMGLNQTLYAIWEDYEFSISDLTVDEEEIFANSDITVSVRTDNWDYDKAYYDIPVELYFDNVLVARSYVDFEEYGVAYLTYTVDVGTVLGTHTLEARINWNDRVHEVNPNNNRVTLEIYTKKDEFGFDVILLTGNARYTEGTEVTTSYLIANDSERNVYPTTNATAYFFVYYYDGDTVVTISKQAWEHYVVPAEERNLIYFRWTVPDGLADVTVYCECSINTDGKLKEPVLDNNVATLETVIAPKRTSQTENPSYSESRPSDYAPTNAPAVNVGSASWNMWEYEYGRFVLKKYGIKVNLTEIYVSPASTCKTAVYENGKWNIKSGYGISIYGCPFFESLSGYELPDDYCYTDIQTVYTTFPEYRYLCEDGKYRVLENVNGTWSFVENEGADENERLHYIPVWCDDGDYVISVTAMDIWTPAGMITAVGNTDCVMVEGNIFDDYYVGN